MQSSLLIDLCLSFENWHFAKHLITAESLSTVWTASKTRRFTLRLEFDKLSWHRKVKMHVFRGQLVLYTQCGAMKNCRHPWHRRTTVCHDEEQHWEKSKWLWRISCHPRIAVEVHQHQLQSQWELAGALHQFGRIRLEWFRRMTSKRFWCGNFALLIS